MNIEKALVVDDSKVAHLTLRKLLTERRIEVDWVGSGEDAIAYMEKHQPDVIFMDVMMPGMDGFETTTAITRSLAPDAPPIIMCSANATEEDKKNARESGAAGFLSKPYTAAQMDQVLNLVREMPGPARQPPPEPPVEEVSVIPFEPITAAAVTEVPPPAPPAAEPPSSAVTAPATLSTVDLERIAERAAWSIADKVARDAASEIAKGKAEQVARAIAEQTARAIAEEVTHKATQAVLQAAQEAAKKAAAETAWSAASEAAQASAGKIARAAAEQIAREISEETTKKSMARGLAVIREDLGKTLEHQVSHTVQDLLARTLAGQEFKQQLTKLAMDALLKPVEASARQAALSAAEQHGAETAGVRRQATLALGIGLAALLIALAAAALSVLR